MVDLFGDKGGRSTLWSTNMMRRRRMMMMMMMMMIRKVHFCIAMEDKTSLRKDL